MHPVVKVRNKLYTLRPVKNGCEGCAFYNGTVKCQAPESAIHKIIDLCTPIHKNGLFTFTPVNPK